MKTLSFAPMQPIVAVDWEKIDHVRITLEKPFGKNGGLRWRQGTTDARKNLNYNAQDKKSGPPYWPGNPVMFPEDGPAIVGTESESFLMPASLSTMLSTRNGETAPDPRAHSAFVAFGFFMAPLTDEDGLVGFTQTTERTRLAAFWNGYKRPPDSKERLPSLQAADMRMVGPPPIPHVALRPLTKNFTPLQIDGEEVVIRPFEFWRFDDASLYHGFDELPEIEETTRMIEGLTTDELDALRGLLKTRMKKNG
jgi:hypothetical protein